MNNGVEKCGLDWRYGWIDDSEMIAFVGTTDTMRYNFRIQDFRQDMYPDTRMTVFASVAKGKNKILPLRSTVEFRS